MAIFPIATPYDPPVSVVGMPNLLTVVSTAVAAYDFRAKYGPAVCSADEINRSIDTVPDQYKLRIAAWNGIIFNTVGIWAVSGFKRPLEQMAAELTEITKPLYDSKVAHSI